MKNVYNAMRVLSLFDGMSCGQIALKEIGITPEVYYASEIDKFAIKQTQLNFPNTIQVGDVRDLNVEDLGHIDLILAGSPCTDGKLINADINGAIGIARKVVGDSFIGKIIDSGFVFNPVRINIL